MDLYSPSNVRVAVYRSAVCDETPSGLNNAAIDFGGDIADAVNGAAEIDRSKTQLASTFWPAASTSMTSSAFTLGQRIRMVVVFFFRRAEAGRGTHFDDARNNFCHV